MVSKRPEPPGQRVLQLRIQLARSTRRIRRIPSTDDVVTWLGGRFDPEAFDLAAVNAALQQVR